ncbi:hypothetical protein F5Y19DRAFT_386108 [Xylariaceae sp. FL1651]|nr:hypothetical protein F5Y19DRAFT_386108 [Xylariaceae sp. FL1651]
MEVVGAVAAVSQLVGMAVTMLDSISQVRDFLRHMPARYQGWHAELTVLCDIISCIQQNSVLHTCQVSRIIEAMTPKIKSLAELCQQHTPHSKAGFITKISNALSARAVEPRIFQSLQSLEHDKTTLILAINLLVRSISSEKFCPITEEMPMNISKPRTKKHSKATQKETTHSSTTVDSSSKLERLRGPRDNGVSHQVPTGPSPLNQTVGGFPGVLSAPMPNKQESTAGVLGASQQGTHSRSTFKGLKLKGSNCLFGTSTGGGADFEDIEVEGDSRVDGDHSADVIKFVYQSKRHGGSGADGTDRNP